MRVGCCECCHRVSEQRQPEQDDMRTRGRDALSYEADEGLVGSRGEDGERRTKHVVDGVDVWFVLVRIQGCRQTETRSDAGPRLCLSVMRCCFIVSDKNRH